MGRTLAAVAVLIACLHLAAANYRTCQCSIRIGGAANARQLSSWSRRLSSCGLFCGRFPGFHVSCDEVRSWCPKTCHGMAKTKMRSDANLDAMCKRYRRTVRPGSGIILYAYSKVMNNCGASWNHFKLQSKLCCLRLPRRNRWIGYRCWWFGQSNGLSNKLHIAILYCRDRKSVV